MTSSNVRKLVTRGGEALWAGGVTRRTTKC